MKKLLYLFIFFFVVSCTQDDNAPTPCTCPNGGGGNTTATCSDGIQNGDETGVDCGGSSCVPCGSSSNCSQFSQYKDRGYYPRVEPCPSQEHSFMFQNMDTTMNCCQNFTYCGIGSTISIGVGNVKSIAYGDSLILTLFHPRYDSLMSQFNAKYDYDFIDDVQNMGNECYGSLHIELSTGTDVYTTKTMNNFNFYYNNIDSINYVGINGYYKIYRVYGWINAKLFKYSNNAETIDIYGEYRTDIEVKY